MKNEAVTIRNLSGVPFGYTLTTEIAKMMSAKVSTDALVDSRGSYNSLPLDEKRDHHEAARALANFLAKHDQRFHAGNIVAVTIQDEPCLYHSPNIIVTCGNGDEIVISTRSQLHIIRRLSLDMQKDFGIQLFGASCSDRYFKSIAPVFGALTNFARTHSSRRDLMAIETRVCEPALKAIIEETRRIFELQPSFSASNMMRYMLGKQDNYNVLIRDDFCVQSLNMDGNLGYGKRLPLPTFLVDFSIDPDSRTTATMSFDAGWQLSLRTHNAEKLAKHFLKFEVKVIGHPYQLTQHHIDYRA